MNYFKSKNVTDNGKDFFLNSLIPNFYNNSSTHTNNPNMKSQQQQQQSLAAMMAMITPSTSSLSSSSSSSSSSDNNFNGSTNITNSSTTTTLNNNHKLYPVLLQPPYSNGSSSLSSSSSSSSSSPCFLSSLCDVTATNKNEQNLQFHKNNKSIINGDISDSFKTNEKSLGVNKLINSNATANISSSATTTTTITGANNGIKCRQGTKKQKLESPNNSKSFQMNNDFETETNEKMSKRSRLDLSSLVDNNAYLPNDPNGIDFLKVNTENNNKKGLKQRRNSKQIGMKNTTQVIANNNNNNDNDNNNMDERIDDNNELNNSMNKSLPLIDAAKIQPEV